MVDRHKSRIVNRGLKRPGRGAARAAATPGSRKFNASLTAEIYCAQGSFMRTRDWRIRSIENTSSRCTIVACRLLHGQRANKFRHNRPSRRENHPTRHLTINLPTAQNRLPALDVAAREHKHVLLQFGANWCGWCHKLHTLFDTDKQIGEIL